MLFAQTASGYIINSNYYDKLITLYEWCLPLLIASIISESNDFPKIELQYLLSSFREAIREDLNLLYTANYIPSILQYGDIDDILKLGGNTVTVKFRTDSFGRVIAN